MAGLDESQRDKRLMMKLVKSTSRWAASVITARLPAKYPPAERDRRTDGAVIEMFHHFEEGKLHCGKVSDEGLMEQRNRGGRKRKWRGRGRGEVKGDVKRRKVRSE